MSGCFGIVREDGNLVETSVLRETGGRTEASRARRCQRMDKWEGRGLLYQNGDRPGEAS